MRLAIIITFIASVCFGQIDPLTVFDSTRRLPLLDYFVNDYARNEYAFFIKNTGQPSHLYKGGVLQPSSTVTGNADLNITAAWQIQSHANGVVVGLVDSGCFQDHEDMVGVVLPGWLFRETPPTSRPDNYDFAGHSTGIAGLIAATKGNGIGSCGIAPGAKILPVSTAYKTSEIALGIVWCVQGGADLVVLSWGETGASDPYLIALSNACVFARQQGVLIVSAVGYGLNLDVTPQYPSGWRMSNVIPVCATTRSGQRFPPSSYGRDVIGAPGEHLVMNERMNQPNHYGYASGNSYASPLVAGVAALILAKCPGCTPDDIANAIRQGCQLQPVSSIYGRLDAHRALEYVTGN